MISNIQNTIIKSPPPRKLCFRYIKTNCRDFNRRVTRITYFRKSNCKHCIRAMVFQMVRSPIFYIFRLLFFQYENSLKKEFYQKNTSVIYHFNINLYSYSPLRFRRNITWLLPFVVLKQFTNCFDDYISFRSVLSRFNILTESYSFFNSHRSFFR